MNNYQKTKEYLALTDKERSFVDLYLQEGSETYLNIELSMTMSKFQITNEQARLTFGRGVLSRANVKAVVEFALRHEVPLPTRDQFLRVVWANAQSKDSKVAIASLQLYADIAGWRKTGAAKVRSAADELEDSSLPDIVYTGDAHGETDHSGSQENSNG